MAQFFAALSRWEAPFLLWVQQALRQPWLSPIVGFYTHLGDRGLVWIALCALLLLFPKTRRAGLAGALALALSMMCTNIVLKPLISRIRPWLVIEGLTPLVTERDPNSFPSGHSSAALAAATAWWRLLPKSWRWVAIGAAAVMALSRLYVGVHFPSDVLCGAVVGAACGAAGAWLVEHGAKGRRQN